jgi:hypothetical protein
MGARQGREVWATAWGISRRGSRYDGIMSGTKGDGPANGNGGDDGSNDDDEDDLVTADTDDRDFDQDLARYAPPPTAVAELCAACVRFVATKYKIELDFTSDTLSFVDQYVRDGRADLAIKPEALDLLQATIGAYLGEVMRRAFGGEWFCEGEHDGWRLDMTYVYLTFNPIGMAREALMLEAQDGWHAHLVTETTERELLEARLKALAEVEEDEYFAPSTRYDIVDIAVNALRSKMIEDGHADVRFTRDDYKR